MPAENGHLVLHDVLSHFTEKSILRNTNSNSSSSSSSSNSSTKIVIIMRSNNRIKVIIIRGVQIPGAWLSG